jgi:hypothetical protein
LNTHTVLCELAAFAVYFLYGSYFEWVFHRYLFHSPKYIYRTFRAHTLVHHQLYKGDHTYHTHDEHPEHVPMDWWAMLAMVAWHLPFFWLFQKLTGIPSLWGGVAAIVVYYGLYESFHWAMHVPRASKVLSRFWYYRFLDSHHLIHHKYMLSNLNVILPLADLTFGTLRDAQGRKVYFWGREKVASGKLTAAAKAPAPTIQAPQKTKTQTAQ